MYLKTIKIAVVLLLVVYLPARTYAVEINSKYAKVSCKDQKLLREFNNRLYMGRLNYLMRGKRSLTVEDEIKNKLDVITEKVEQVLEMYPPNLRYSFRVCVDIKEVQEYFIKLHKKSWSRPGFYSPAYNQIFISAENTRLNVIAHEVGHVVVENYFKVRPPAKVHELLAQYAEKHIAD